jgi:hypothetical protein
LPLAAHPKRDFARSGTHRGARGRAAIDPGGTSDPVTHIAFLGSEAVAADIGDHAATRQLGESLAARLVHGALSCP